MFIFFRLLDVAGFSIFDLVLIHLGRCNQGKVLYLEDLYIKEDFRRHGLGCSAIRILGNIALRADCGRFSWQVLDWNEPAMRCYSRV